MTIFKTACMAGAAVAVMAAALAPAMAQDYRDDGPPPGWRHHHHGPDFDGGDGPRFHHWHHWDDGPRFHHWDHEHRGWRRPPPPDDY